MFEKFKFGSQKQEPKQTSKVEQQPQSKQSKIEIKPDYDEQLDKLDDDLQELLTQKKITKKEFQLFRDQRAYIDQTIENEEQREAEKLVLLNFERQFVKFRRERESISPPKSRGSHKESQEK